MYPPIFNTFSQISTIYLLPHKLGILQIRMMGVLVVVEVNSFSVLPYSVIAKLLVPLAQ
jgi:hypothetical protein